MKFFAWLCKEVWQHIDGEILAILSIWTATGFLLLGPRFLGWKTMALIALSTTIFIAVCWVAVKYQEFKHRA